MKRESVPSFHLCFYLFENNYVSLEECYAILIPVRTLHSALVFRMWISLPLVCVITSKGLFCWQ